MSVVYLDTSLLANRYLASSISTAVDSLLDEPSHTFVISELCLVEFESALTRQHREGRITARNLGDLRRRFEGDMQLEFFSLHPLSKQIVVGARELIASALAPLATLDSLHVQSAIDSGAETFATDDRQLARAAAKHGLQIITL